MGFVVIDGEELSWNCVGWKCRAGLGIDESYKVVLVGGYNFVDIGVFILIEIIKTFLCSDQHFAIVLIQIVVDHFRKTIDRYTSVKDIDLSLQLLEWLH